MIELIVSNIHKENLHSETHIVLPKVQAKF
jgi:hypothetical protein